MKIRTASHLIVRFSLLLLVLFGLVLIYSLQQQKMANLEEERSDQISEKIIGLNILANEYLLFRSERARRQWWTVYDEIGRLCSSATFTGRERLSLVTAITDKHAHLGELFSLLLGEGEKVTRAEPSDETLASLFSQFQIEVQALIGLAFALHEETVRHSRIVQNLALAFRVALFVGLFLLVVGNSFWLLRRLVTPITRLHHGTEIIGSGNLEHKVGTDTTDEIGQLSRAFDHMIGNLRQTMASRDDLAREVAARLAAEKRLTELMRELERSNKDLEQFAHIASHDLQEPARTVASFVQLLARRYQDKLDSDAREFIAFAVEGCERMQGMIRALLLYSRVGTQGQPLAPVDCNQVLAEVIASLTVYLEENGAAVSLPDDPLPVVMADRHQLGQLFQNLLANAVKFKGKESPRLSIRVRCLADGLPPEMAAESRARLAAALATGPPAMREGWLFAVQDNGIGFAPEYAEQIFEVFRRLHPIGKYQGSGIGLAVCRKIVERHGGIIWAESALGQGTVFYFTLPRVAAGE